MPLIKYKSLAKQKYFMKNKVDRSTAEWNKGNDRRDRLIAVVMLNETKCSLVIYSFFEKILIRNRSKTQSVGKGVHFNYITLWATERGKNILYLIYAFKTRNLCFISS
jgi:hypothetical protein